MTLNFRNMLKFPWTQNPNENQTLDVFDLPKMYQDVYGVSHIEFQHDHLVNGEQTPPDAAFFREMRAKLDAAKVTATQVNIEIGEIPNLAGEAREKWMTLGRQWVDAAPIIGVTRLMLNQTGLNRREHGQLHVGVEGDSGLREAKGDQDLGGDEGHGWRAWRRPALADSRRRRLLIPAPRRRRRSFS